MFRKLIDRMRYKEWYRTVPPNDEPIFYIVKGKIKLGYFWKGFFASEHDHIYNLKDVSCWLPKSHVLEKSINIL
jgi:hypothetical protein